MINDYLEIRNAEGMPKLIDSSIALNLLLSAKNGIVNYANAFTETATPEVKTVIKKQLNDAIDLHEKIYTLMLKKNWFSPYDLQKQFSMDTETSNAALQIAGLNLFPNDSNRLGNFATPFK